MVKIEHHRVFSGTTTFGENLGVTRMLDPARAKRLFIEGQRGNRIDPPRKREINRGDEIIVGRSTGAGADPTRTNIGKIIAGGIVARDDVGGGLGLDRVRHLLNFRDRADMPERTIQHGSTADHDGPSQRPQRRFTPRPRDHFGANACNVSHCESHQRPVVDHVSLLSRHQSINESQSDEDLSSPLGRQCRSSFWKLRSARPTANAQARQSIQPAPRSSQLTGFVFSYRPRRHYWRESY